MIAASRQQKMWDLKDKPLFQFFLLKPECHPKDALLSASQWLRALFPQCPPLRTSTEVCERYLASAVPWYRIC